MNYFFEQRKQMNFVPFIPNNIQSNKETSYNLQIHNQPMSPEINRCNYPNYQDQKNTKLIGK